MPILFVNDEGRCISAILTITGSLLLDNQAVTMNKEPSHQEGRLQMCTSVGITLTQIYLLLFSV